MRKTDKIEILSAPFIVLFLYSALSKLLEYKVFIVQISQNKHLVSYANELAWLIPSIELITAMLLVRNRYRKAGLYLSAFLMSIFTIYILFMLIYDSKLPCTCGGVLSIMSWKQHLAFNIAFLLLSFYGIFFKKTDALFQRLINKCSYNPDI